jgi:hypothetical protein
MQEVHTYILRERPPTTALTRWTFGSQRRFVRRCEWLTDIPKEGFLPHISHTAATTRHSGSRND